MWSVVVVCYLKFGLYGGQTNIGDLAGVIMARYRRGKMALYEVMSKAKEKPGYKRTLEKIRTGKPSDEEPVVEKEEAVVSETTVAEDASIVSDEKTAVEGHEAVKASPLSVQWRRKPRVVQYNNGRIEFSVPYQMGIAVVLGLVVVMLLAFRAGQRSVVVEKAGANSPPVNAARNRQDPVVGGNKAVRNDTTPEKATMQDSGKVGAAATTGSNVIVLVQYRSERDLVPVRAHFASYGIATEIVPLGGQYFLVTQDRYNYNSFAPGGDGYLAKQRIAEVGADYKGKAPKGYEPFAPHYFDDAYGKPLE